MIVGEDEVHEAMHPVLLHLEKSLQRRVPENKAYERDAARVQDQERAGRGGEAFP